VAGAADGRTTGVYIWMRRFLPSGIPGTALRSSLRVPQVGTPLLPVVPRIEPAVPFSDATVDR
jgi:hypothetical protein